MYDIGPEYSIGSMAHVYWEVDNLYHDINSGRIRMQWYHLANTIKSQLPKFIFVSLNLRVV